VPPITVFVTRPPEAVTLIPLLFGIALFPFASVPM